MQRSYSHRDVITDMSEDQETLHTQQGLDYEVGNVVFILLLLFIFVVYRCASTRSGYTVTFCNV